MTVGLLQTPLGEPYLAAATLRITSPEEMQRGIKTHRFTSHSPAASRQSGGHVNSDLIAADKYGPSLSSYFPVT